MFERMWRDEYLVHDNVRYIIRTQIQLSFFIWYIECAYFLTKTATTDDVILNKFEQVWGFLHISSKNIKSPIVLLSISFHVLHMIRLMAY